MRHRVRIRKTPRRGVATVEAAIVLPLLVLLTFGFVEVGFYINSHHLLHDAARRGARAAVHPENSNAEVNAAVRSSLANALGIDSESVSATVQIYKLNANGSTAYQVQNLDANEQGEAVRVTVQINYSQFGAPSNYLGLGGHTMSSSVVMQRQK